MIVTPNPAKIHYAFSKKQVIESVCKLNIYPIEPSNS